MADDLVLPVEKSIKGSSGGWYRIHELLGSGGNAVTYLVICTAGPSRGVPFALKFFRRLSKPERRTAFLDELAFLKSCDHPSIMRVYDDGTFVFHENDGAVEYPFLVAEYLPNTLARVIRASSVSITERWSTRRNWYQGLLTSRRNRRQWYIEMLSRRMCSRRGARACWATSDSCGGWIMRVMKTETF